MPSKKKKYNARFPAGRIKKIMQSDEEIGKVAQAVPVIISRTLELFVESLLTKTLKITNSRNAKTLSPSHMKQCIMSERRFDFLRELVKNVPDINVAEEAANYNEIDALSSPEEPYPDSDTPYDLSMPSTSARARATTTNGYENTRSQGLNGGGYNSGGAKNEALKRDYEVVQLLQQHIENRSIPTNSSVTSGVKSSVIMHTTAVMALECDEPPAKLLRSESMPGSVHLPYQRTRQSHANSRSHLQQQSTAAIASTTTVSSQSNNSKRSRQVDTAIPAPIVNFELPLKPVVKIDYSNLHIPHPEDHLTPLSAPPHLNSAQSSSGAFDFSAEPIINIDLSNIVTNADSAANITPAIATISIGPLPPVTKELLSVSSASSSSPPPASSIKLTMNPKARITPSVIHSHAAKTLSFIPPPPKPTVTTVKDSFCELDEDYDNI